MTASSIVKRLVEEVKQEPQTTEHEEDLPIEYYEMKEIARHRVLLKDSFRIHLIIYIITNLLLTIYNLYYNPFPVKDIYGFWAAWPMAFWGMLLWIHLWVVKTSNVTNLQLKIFFIVLISNVYLAWLLIYLNYFGTMQYLEMDIIWWPWALLFLAVFTLVYGLYVAYSKNEAALEKDVEKEIVLMKKDYEKEIEKMNRILEKTKKYSKKPQQSSLNTSEISKRNPNTKDKK